MFTFSTSSPRTRSARGAHATPGATSKHHTQHRIICAKTPQNAFSRNSWCYLQAPYSASPLFSAHFQERNPGCQFPARVFPIPARTEHMRCCREVGSSGYGGSGIGTPEELGGSGSVVVGKIPVRRTCFRKRNHMDAKRPDIGVSGEVCAEHGDGVAIVFPVGQRRSECHDDQGAWTTSAHRIFIRFSTSIFNVIPPCGGA